MMKKDYTPHLQIGIRAMVRSILADVAKNGFVGDSHLFVTFKTDHPGVVLHPLIKQKYPTQMSIVLQHQFSNLTVDDEAFSVDLAFGGAPYTLRVPYTALMVFTDPTMEFGLNLTPEMPHMSEAEKKADVIDLSARRK